MDDEKRAAIDLDSLGDKGLAEISAADFLNALNTAGVAPLQALKVWPEKKKYELYLEPENISRVRVRDLINTVTEKKKVEFEVEYKSPGAERVQDVRSLIRDPDFIRQLAKEVSAHLRGI